MKIVIGSDHAAFEAKQELIKFLENQHEIVDVGPTSQDRTDYPKYAIAVVEEMFRSDSLGILLCGSGIGVSIVANRFKGIRAALCRTPEEAILSKQHNNANVLCLGARISSKEEIEAIVSAWLEASFEEGRHSDRLAMFEDLGE